MELVYDSRGRPMYMLRGVRVLPEYDFKRSGHAQRISGRKWKLSRKLADYLYTASLRRQVLGEDDYGFGAAAYREWWQA